MIRRSFLIAFLAVAATLAGCTTWATYPPIPGAAGVNDPTLAPIPELMALGILEAHGPESPDAAPGEASPPIVFNLPPDTPISTYKSVRRRITGSRWMEPGDEMAYHVHEVRVRMFDAEVDIIFAPTGGAYQMTTFVFKNKAGWKLERRRDWGMRVRVPDRHEPLPAGMRGRPSGGEADEADEAEMAQADGA